MKPLFLYAAIMFVGLASCAPPPLTESVVPEHGWRARRTPEERAETQTAYLHKRLRLSAGQVEAVHILLLRAARQIQAIWDRDAGRAAAHQQLLDLLTRRDAALTPLLTDEQRTRFARLRNVQSERMNERYLQMRKAAQP